MAKKNKKHGKTQRQQERDRLLVSHWVDRWIAAGLEARKPFIDALEEADKYLESDHDHLYASLGKFVNTKGMLCLTVNLMQQVRGYMGPHLYARNPVRTVTPTTNAPEFLALAEIMNAYLNATPEDTRLMDHERKKVDEALVAGRGVSWTKKDESSGLICTQHVPVRDVILDPDARAVDEIQWVAIRMQEPLHVVKRRYGKDAEGLKPDVLTPSDNTLERRNGEGKPVAADMSALAGKTSHVLRYYVIYSKMGSGMTHGNLAKDEDGNAESHRGSDGETLLHKKLVIVPGYDKPIYEGRWDLSLYLDDDWPIGFLDFTPTLKGSKAKGSEERNGGLWPPSLMGLGLSHQKAIDVLATRVMNDVLNRSRLLLALGGDAADQDEVEKALREGDPWKAIKLAESANAPMDQLLKKFDLGQVDQAYWQALEWNETKFGEVTGMNPVLKGGMDTRQIRSALEAEMRDRNSRSRIEDMASQVETAAKYVARREGLGVRLDLEPEEVERVVRDRLNLNRWKVRVIFNGEELGLRDLREGGMFPAAGNYFGSQEEAQQLAQAIMQNGVMVEAAWRAENPEGEWKGIQAMAVPVTVKEVWNDTAGLEPSELAKELNYRIEAGSARRPDHNKRIEEAQQNLQLLSPILVQLQQFDELNRLLEARYEAYQTPHANRVYVNAQTAQQFLQAQQQAMQQQAQQAQQAQQQTQQHELMKVQATEKAKAEREIAVGAAMVAMDPVGGGGYA